jgi:hypothetical protein
MRRAVRARGCARRPRRSSMRASCAPWCWEDATGPRVEALERSAARRRSESDRLLVQGELLGRRETRCERGETRHEGRKTRWGRGETRRERRKPRFSRGRTAWNRSKTRCARPECDSVAERRRRASATCAFACAPCAGARLPVGSVGRKRRSPLRKSASPRASSAFSWQERRFHRSPSGFSDDKAELPAEPAAPRSQSGRLPTRPASGVTQPARLPTSDVRHAAGSTFPAPSRACSWRFSTNYATRELTAAGE